MSKDSAGRAGKVALRTYLRDWSLANPAYFVVRHAGTLLRDEAERYFCGRLLDIGCGNKSKQLLVGDLVDEYVGLDHADTLHDLTQADLIGNAYEIPVPDASFDSVLCTAVLEHLEDPRAALLEAFRILKPGGYALYTAPLYWHLHEEPRDFFRYTRHGLQHLFSAAGWEIIDIVSMSGFWGTFLTQFNYYLARYARGPLAYLLAPPIALNNLAAFCLDRGVLRDERFTWLYLVVARKK
ncbi:MAG: class I SAM-dependent methyltransferase [Burkholderiales bacterium]|nr:class I SAM-dependent methyltransferase [Burkholderiales bacterium]